MKKLREIFAEIVDQIAPPTVFTTSTIREQVNDFCVIGALSNLNHYVPATKEVHYQAKEGHLGEYRLLRIDSFHYTDPSTNMPAVMKKVFESYPDRQDGRRATDPYRLRDILPVLSDLEQEILKEGILVEQKPSLFSRTRHFSHAITPK